MACLAGSLLNALTCTLHVGAMTAVSDFMTLLAVSLLNALTYILHVGAITACDLSVLGCYVLLSKANVFNCSPTLMWMLTSRCHLYPKMSLYWGSSQLYSP
ncbi:hypothetical protein EDD17DRAFT_450497 [Pisolithus thermaeus]|nr:hypothetical protein EDD17DRAFT_450497 [Pisolithus thermaeus]